MLVSKFRTLIRLLRQLDRISLLEDEVRGLREQMHALQAQAARIADLAPCTEAAAERAEQIAARVESIVTAGIRDVRLGGSRLELEVGDLKRLLVRGKIAPPDYYLSTLHPVASQSADHKFPRGTINDDTRWPRFCKKAELIFQGKRMRFLDIGCAGGGLVFDFLMRGHDAVGIEGSDLNWLMERAHWGVIPDRLFTCDAAQPYRFMSTEGGRQIEFDLISCWEVLEHVPEPSLKQFFRNVKTHLSESGLFVASVATFEDGDTETGAVWHVTVKPRSWWFETLARFDLQPVESLFVHEDFARGSGNPFASDWDAKKSPELGFHIVATHAATRATG